MQGFVGTERRLSWLSLKDGCLQAHLGDEVEEEEEEEMVDAGGEEEHAEQQDGSSGAETGPGAAGAAGVEPVWKLWLFQQKTVFAARCDTLFRP